MRIVLDTNVLVSGLLSPFGPPGDILRLITTWTVRVCYDARILGEYSQAARSKREISAQPAEGFRARTKALPNLPSTSAATASTSIPVSDR